MRKKILFTFFLQLYFYPIIPNHEKHVIGPWPNGFFSSFFAVLNHLAWAKKNHKIPVIYWDDKSIYYQKEGFMGATNVWEYYFEPVSDVSYQTDDIVFRSFQAPDGSVLTPFKAPDVNGFSCLLVNEARVSVKSIIDEFIKIRPYILNIVTNFKKEHRMDDIITIGIHLRGTDKQNEVEAFNSQLLLEAANDFVKKNRLSNYQFLIATDEQKLLDLAKKELRGKVIYTDAKRSYSWQGLHWQATYAHVRAQLGLDVLTEALLLASSNVFIHTCSNVSSAVLYFNTALEDIAFYKDHSEFYVHICVDKNFKY